MQISEALGLQKTQPELDFVDIELSTDTPLFLDPAALYEGSSPFAEGCAKDLEAFFEAVLHAAMTENDQLGLYLLRGLGEPDEIFLGFSSGEPHGRGVGEKQAETIFKADETQQGDKIWIDSRSKRRAHVHSRDRPR